MSHITEYQDKVRRYVPLFKSMPVHQATVYAIETVVESALPLSEIGLDSARRFIEEVSMEVDIDMPEVVRKSVRSFEACASHNAYTIVLSRSTCTTLTLCHELAHLMCGAGEGHHEQWRSTFVRLARRFISVEHGALLHNLYNKHDLPCEWS